jgi:hypothetical protein
MTHLKGQDYYATPSAFPKWMGYALGGLFGMIALGCLVVIVNMVRATNPPAAPAASLVAAVRPEPAAPQPAHQPKLAAAPARSDVADQAPAPAKQNKKSMKQMKKQAAKKQRAFAKKGPSFDSKAKAILAKRDSKASKSSKDAIDRLLGL